MNWALTFFSQGSPAPMLQAWFLFQRSEVKVAKNMHPILWDLLFLSIFKLSLWLNNVNWDLVFFFSFHASKPVACNNTQKYAEMPKQKPQAKTRRRIEGTHVKVQRHVVPPQGKIKEPFQ